MKLQLFTTDGGILVLQDLNRIFSFQREFNLLMSLVLIAYTTITLFSLLWLRDLTGKEEYFLKDIVTSQFLSKDF